MKRDTAQYVVCVRNEDYTASLELRKIYTVIPDSDAEAHGMIRLVDESGEDYLYPRDLFLPIDVPQTISRAFAMAC
ncbi:MAG: hypothetical protein A3K19_22250 [Lentisphaerae bacterium RIFOXYB12_FULL_65_16]|nr:MAG: hypothetical protein A3K18_21320 [Lentisphaerae bacterium RIFOXYA12_64_32]OGV93583.1 MAG: hypothetical protein A3K19_22250 [Lentisphaerae bacterium RIFOXYB12_FULL_65_16]